MARELPIHNGRLTTDLDADGHRIVNLPGGGTDSVSWENVTGKPTFAIVATSGSYNDLTGKPAIPPAVTVDDTVTRTSANPVRSSGIWGAIWGALTALPTGFTALYDWVVSQLAGKLSTSGGTMTGALAFGGSMPDGGERSIYYNGDQWHFKDHLGDVVTLPKYAIGTTALAATTATAGNIAALDANGNPVDSGIAKTDVALAADLRYRIAEAGYATTGAKLPEGVTVRMNGGVVSYEIERFSLPLPDMVRWRMVIAGGMAFIWNEDGTNGVDGMLGYKFYDANGDEIQGVPNLLVPHALSDRTVNLITAESGIAASIDIELPAAVTVDDVRYCRDFILDVDNSANASDLALEFTALGADYAFVPLEDDSISDVMTIGGGERVRLYFTETPYTATGSLPVINVARVTLGDFVSSTTPATQGGN